jgi:hypothetical protein
MFGVRIVALAATLSGIAVLASLDTAEARPRQAAEGSYAGGFGQPRAESRQRLRGASQKLQVRATAAARVGVGPRPARWCGWWLRTQLGGGPELNLARNWKSWGRPSGPRVGAVVVWSSHVGIITGRTASGQWIVKSGNDGGRVRERPRSVSGAVFRAA